MLTWHDISCVHSIFILDEAKAIHKLDFLYGACAMGTKMVFDVLFCD
jgi:hypothetical protein